MSRYERVGVVGAGQFGTALADLMAKNGRDVLVWSRNADVVAEINEQHSNEVRCPGVALAPSLEATNDPAELAERARFLVMAVPSTDIRVRAQDLGEVVDGHHIIVHAIGALAVPQEVPTGVLRVSELLAQETPVLRIGVLAGPALPGDLIHGNYASMVVASHFDEVGREARRLLGVPPVLRIYQGHDVVGVELAAVMSGAYTIAVGIADALGIGAGPRAVLITRVVAEAARLGAAAGGEARTFAGLAGLGNLLVRTSEKSGKSSREYQLGLALGRGDPPPAGRAPEGARAAEAGKRLADEVGVRVPVLSAVAAVVLGEMTAEEAARAAADTVALEE